MIDQRESPLDMELFAQLPTMQMMATKSDTTEGWLVVEARNASTAVDDGSRATNLRQMIGRLKQCVQSQKWFDRRRAIEKTELDAVDRPRFRLPVVMPLDGDLGCMEHVFPDCSFRVVVDSAPVDHGRIAGQSRERVFLDRLAAFVRQHRVVDSCQSAECASPMDEETLLMEAPMARRYTIYEDMMILHARFVPDSLWRYVMCDEMLDAVCDVWRVRRVARKDEIHADGWRTPRVRLLRSNGADDSHVTIRQNGVVYRWDVTRCMFSQGNIREKLRMARLDVENEVIVDLCAGLGYFTLPLLVHGNAKKVYACDWNPYAIEALRDNLRLNGIVAERCEIIEGDHRLCPIGRVADRVLVGLIPSSEHAWPTAVKCLNPTTGGIIHLHGNVAARGEADWCRHVVAKLRELFDQLYPSPDSLDSAWHIHIDHLECVKSYAPRVNHCVADVQCRPTSNILRVPSNAQ